MRRLTIIITSLLALAAVAAVARAGEAPAAAGEQGDGITVQGSGSVTSVPDRAQLSFGVETQAATAKAALAANGAEMRKVIAAIKAAGATDVQTQSVSLYPRYAESTGNGSGAVQGYVAQNSVSATIRELEKAGAVIDAAVGAGANKVSGPALSRGDQDELYRQALRAAVADARLRAQALATAANVSLGRVTQIVEGGAAPPPGVLDATKSSEASSTPIEPGEQQLVASVTVTFAAS
ncbi:MAG: SIMPL domain-containing protein [Gaiellaceae bacterium MAG52_C11]|nr:SIMPL domain-containing protein [Candidatus Gaiellasilicea maunaloa]